MINLNEASVSGKEPDYLPKLFGQGFKDTKFFLKNSSRREHFNYNKTHL